MTTDQYIATLHRSHAKARHEGLSIVDTVSINGEPSACRVTSSQPGYEPYVVVIRPSSPLLGCDCAGYEANGYCKHYALALAHFDLLPPFPESAIPPKPARDPKARRAAAAADLEKRNYRKAA